MLMTQVKVVQASCYFDVMIGLVGWIPPRPRWKIGEWVTLKGEEGRWRITEVYATLNREKIHSDWEVGGV